MKKSMPLRCLLLTDPLETRGRACHPGPPTGQVPVSVRNQKGDKGKTGQSLYWGFHGKVKSGAG